jgi:gamma-glutamyl hercynylcysteine S-oxide synthase
LIPGNADCPSPPDTLLQVAIEHRFMHAETLGYMLHQLPHERKISPTRAAGNKAIELNPGMVEIPGGPTTLGLSRADKNAFGWDNEYEAHAVQVPAFAIDRYMITNREYLEFIAAGGYENAEFWNEADWKWRTENNIQAPVFWSLSGGRWQYRTMFDVVSLPLDWPVYVSHAEAEAYTRWVGKSLPTEAQWQRTAYGADRIYPWGNSPPDANKGNFDFRRWDPTSVGSFPEGKSGLGVFDLLGNGWEWTSSLFEPFSGFKAFSFYPGYSADFFDGKHYVIKGGSARTAASMLRPSFRNWFQPRYQYVYAGFRCVKN